MALLWKSLVHLDGYAQHRRDESLSLKKEQFFCWMRWKSEKKEERRKKKEISYVERVTLLVFCMPEKIT
jgi:hypothetical protein